MSIMADRKISYRHNGTVTFDKNVARRINIFTLSPLCGQPSIYFLTSKENGDSKENGNLNYASSAKMGPEDVVGWGIRF